MNWKLFFGRWSRNGTSRGGRRPSARLRVETLESRVVPAVWTGAAGDANWSTPGNWDTNAVPTFSDDVQIPTGVAVISASDFAQAGTVTIDGGKLDIQGLLDTGSFSQTSGVTLIEASGQLFAFGSFSQSGGDTGLLGGMMRSPSFDLSGGLMTGFGSLNTRREISLGTFTNEGGTLEAVTGTLFLDGNYRQTAAGTLILAPVTSSSSSDALFQISGLASLDGELDFVITTGTADTYPLITYGSFKGAFATVVPVPAAGFTVTGVDYLSTELDAVMQPLPPTTLPPTALPPTALPPTTVTPTLPDPFIITQLQRISNPTTPTPTPGASTPTNSSNKQDLAALPPSGITNGNRLPPPDLVANAELFLGRDDPLDPLDTKPHPRPVGAHGFEEFEIDNVLADELDHILRVQIPPIAVGFERDALSGASIVRALLTGTTPRTDLLAQGSQVASVATLLVNTEIPSRTLLQPAERDFDLPNLLIAPVRVYPELGLPAEPAPVGPISDAGHESGHWWDAVALMAAFYLGRPLPDSAANTRQRRHAA
jgi:hypothetical protein